MAASSNRTRPLKILQLKQESSEVEILTENLDIISKNLVDSGANLVSVVSVMGTYRTGKSFLLDLLTRYLKRKAAKEAAEESRVQVDPLFDKAGNATSAPNGRASKADGWRFGEDDRQKAAAPEWVLEGNSSRIHEGSKLDEQSDGFAWRPGKDKCTQGIWLWSTPFVFRDKDDRRVAVLLMDTQGAWDDTMTKAQSATIFGLTALLSSKLVYNIQNRIEEDKLENMDYITTFAQTVCADLPGKEAPFGHLELFIRDWVNFEDGYSFEQCKAQMAEHLDDHISPQKVPQDAVPRVERLKSTFKSIDAWGLPHPGLKVTKPTYTGEIDLIDRDFLYLLDKFGESFFGGSFPQPSAPLGCEITPGSFKRVVLNFAQAFRDNAQDMAIGLREAFVKVETITFRDDLAKRFREQLNRLAPDTAVMDPVDLAHDVDELINSLVDEFRMKLKPWRMADDDENAAVLDFIKTITEVANSRMAANNQQVEGATLKLVASPVVGTGAYFLLAHQIILMAVMGTSAYIQANKHAKRDRVEIYDPTVFAGVFEDAKKFGLQRYKDVQAMQIALSRITPKDAMESLMSASKQAGVMAAAAGAAGSQAAAGSAEGAVRPGGQQARAVAFK
ncbi:unnamed protein product [Polarella glacialis]|uniref:GB1/RHD3-type G domain-containing protein n=1 Tax=Polarella glacialis TaxID=89957 RepID=A0A813HVB4_POLGL|nr:unnamed protein product [Polarella glacialis]|mmetsp:Transcript_44702/g.72543  ORF Transcript_44702/g.72543 Transcript_44702/m.72543 type:complete len:617 (-) Transcript_44702:119-1969(-)